MANEIPEEFGEPSAQDKELTETFNEGRRQALDELGLKEKPKYRIGQTVYVIKNDGEMFEPYYRVYEHSIIGIIKNSKFIEYVLNHELGIHFSGSQLDTTKQDALKRMEKLNEDLQTPLQKKLGDERYKKIEEAKAPQICGISADELNEADLLIALKLIGADFDFSDENTCK